MIATLTLDLFYKQDLGLRTEEKIGIFEFHSRNLEEMKRQFQYGENIELPQATLGRWHEDLLQQQELVDALRNELSQIGANN